VNPWPMAEAMADLDVSVRGGRRGSQGDSLVDQYTKRRSISLTQQPSALVAQGLAADVDGHRHNSFSQGDADGNGHGDGRAVQVDTVLTALVPALKAKI